MDEKNPGSPPTGKVLIRRWPDNYSLVGPATIIKDMEEAALLLAQSAWMHGWVAAKIKEELAAGGTFSFEKRDLDPGSWKGRADRVVAEWRIATDKEVLDYVDTAKFAEINGHVASKKSQDVGYILHYHEGVAMIKAYDNLPRQAKVILDCLNEADREIFTEAAIAVILEANKEKLKSRQEPMLIFGFYRARFRNEGHLTQI